MNEAKKSMEPWQLILILVLMLAFFGGLYVTNQSIGAKLDSVEASVLGSRETLKTKIDGLENRLESLMSKAAPAKFPAPIPAPAPAPAPVAPVPPQAAQ